MRLPRMTTSTLMVAVPIVAGVLGSGLATVRGESGKSPDGKGDATVTERNRMVQRDLAERGINNSRVLEAFRIVPRHRFLPESFRRQAYSDESVPTSDGGPITPPYEIAFMTEALNPTPGDKVLEVGTGSGYQAAVLSRLVKEVYSVEIHKSLSELATRVLKEVGYSNVHTRHGDGYAGWPEAAPFDAIIVTCAPEMVPQSLVEQLKEGGRMVIPVGSRSNQVLHLIVKKDGKLTDRELGPVLFVPMRGKAQLDSANSKRREEERKR